MKITNEHINKFKKIKRLFFNMTKVPKSNNWKDWTNNDIWLHFVVQVIVVGSSTATHKFYGSSDLKKLVSYNRLSDLEDENEIKKSINYVLRKAGTRYSSKNIDRCRKTQALAHNLKILKGFKSGPKGLLKRVSGFTGVNESKRKVKYFMKIFKFFKSKSARDFLIELGIIKDAIALDVRVQNVLKKVGIEIPKGLESNPKLYDEVEKELLDKVCKPLKLSGAQFDRMIYQNYNEIIKMKFS